MWLSSKEGLLRLEVPLLLYIPWYQRQPAGITGGVRRKAVLLQAEGYLLTGWDQGVLRGGAVSNVRMPRYK